MFLAAGGCVREEVQRDFDEQGELGAAFAACAMNLTRDERQNSPPPAAPYEAVAR
jgi:hypothetical protein